MMEIEHIFEELTKHDQIRVEQWSKKISLRISNPEFKKDRNDIAKLLLVNCRKKKLDSQFRKPPPEGELISFSK